MPSEAEQIMQQLNQSSHTVSNLTINGVRISLRVTEKIRNAIATIKAKEALEIELAPGEKELVAFLKAGKKFTTLEMTKEQVELLQKDALEYHIQFAKNPIYKKEPLLNPEGKPQLSPSGNPLFRSEIVGYQVAILDEHASNFNFWVKTREIAKPEELKNQEISPKVELDNDFVERIFGNPEILNQYLKNVDGKTTFDMTLFTEHYLAFSGDKNLNNVAKKILSVMFKCDSAGIDAIDMGSIDDPVIDKVKEEMDLLLAQRSENKKLTTLNKSKPSSRQQEEMLDIDSVVESEAGPVNPTEKTFELDESKYSIAQAALIKNGIEENIDASIYANPELSIEQMQFIREQLNKNNIQEHLFDYKILANPELSIEQMQIISNAISNNCNLEGWSNPNYSVEHMNLIVDFQQRNFDYSKLMDYQITSETLNLIQEQTKGIEDNGKVQQILENCILKDMQEAVPAVDNSKEIDELAEDISINIHEERIVEEAPEHPFEDLIKIKTVEDVFENFNNSKDGNDYTLAMNMLQEIANHQSGIEIIHTPEPPVDLPVEI